MFCFSPLNVSSELFFTGAERVGTADDCEINLGTAIRDGLENANSDLSLPLFDMVDRDDSIFPQSLTDSCRAETGAGCMQFNSLEVVNSVSEEIGSNGSSSSDLAALPAAVEAAGKYESTHVETECPAQQHPDTAMGETFVGTSESTNGQQSELSESHAASEELIAEHFVEMRPGDGIASKCTQNKDTVEFPLESEIHSTGCQVGDNRSSTSVTVTERPSEQQSEQVALGVTADEESGKSPVSTSDKDVGEEVPAETSQTFTTEADDAKREDVDANLDSSHPDEAEIADSSSSVRQAEDVQDDRKSGDVVDVALDKTGSSYENEPTTEQRSTSDSDGEATDESSGSLARNKETEKHSDSALENGTVSGVTSNDQVVSLPLMEETESRVSSVVDVALEKTGSSCENEPMTGLKSTSDSSGEKIDQSSGNRETEEHSDSALEKGTVSDVTSNEQIVPHDEIQGSTGVSSAATSLTDGNSTLPVPVDNNVNGAESNDVHCTSEAENAGQPVLTEDKDPVKHDNGDDGATMNETSILPTSDVSERIELDGVYIDLSPIADTVVDAVISDCLSQTSELDMQLECDTEDKSAVESGKLSPGTSELLHIASMASEAANTQEFVADGDQSLLLSGEEAPAETSKTSTTEVDDANREAVSANLDSSLPHEAEIADSTSSSSVTVRQAEDVQDDQKSGDVVDVALDKTGSSCDNEPVIGKVQRSTSDFAGETTDESIGSLARNEETEKHSDSALENGTVSGVTGNEQVVSLPLMEETESHVSSGISVRSGDLCKAAEVLSEVSKGKSDAALVPSAGLTSTTPVTEAVEPESCSWPGNTSRVIILKQPTTSKQLSTPVSTSAVLSSCDKEPATDKVQDGTIASAGSSLSGGAVHQLGSIIQPSSVSTAASSVTGSTGGMHQRPPHVTLSSVTETHPTITTICRPAAGLAMNVGKNLVTEFVFREIAAHEAKWKNASEKQKVTALSVSRILLTYFCELHPSANVQSVSVCVLSAV